MSVPETTATSQVVVVQFLVNTAECQNPLEVLKQKLNSIVSPDGKGECAGSPIVGFNLVAKVDHSSKPRNLVNGENDDDHYLMVMEGDVSPTLHGPYASDARRVTAAQTYRVDNGDEDGLYRLNVPKGTNVTVGEFVGAEVQGGVYDELTNSVISSMLNNESPIQRICVPGSKNFTVFFAGDEILASDDLLAAVSERFDSPLVEFTNGACDYLYPECLVQAAMRHQWTELTAVGHTTVSFATWAKKKLKGPYKAD